MKIFTRLFITLCIVAFTGKTSMAGYDVLVKDMYATTTASNTVPDGFTTLLWYTFENLGDDLQATDTFTTAIIINNDTVFGPFRVYGGAANGVSFDIPTDVSFNGQTVTFPYTFEGDPGTTFDICAYVILPTGLVDDDGSNNYTCHTTITIADNINMDLAVKGLKLITPDYNDLDSFDVYHKTKTPPAIEEMEAMLINNTELDLSGYTLGFLIYIGKDEYNAVHAPSVFAAGDTATLTISNEAVIPAVPKKAGSYKVCVALTTVLDDQSNDTTCLGFKLIDTWVPVGISEENAVPLDVYYANQNLWISNIVEPTTVTIMDVQGRLVSTELLTRSGSIPVNVSSGAYIVRSQNESTGEVKSQKISIQ
ncbi:MAG: T9SS type A sorting domain-containing protein [Flavobacteriales bacterium]